MSKIADFLTDAGTFYFATVDGTSPKVRPFGFFMEYNGKLYFGMGTHKEVWKQIQKNPEVEVVAVSKEGKWIRIHGTAVVDSTPEASKTAFEKAPFLSSIYNAESKLTLGLLWLDKGDAAIIDMAGNTEKVPVNS